MKKLEVDKLKIIHKDNRKEQKQKSTTTSEIMLKNYIKKITASNSFKSDLKDLKIRCGVPENGFEKESEDKKLNSIIKKQYANFDSKKYIKEIAELLENYGITKSIAPTWVNTITLGNLYKNSITPQDLYSVYGEPTYGMIDVLDISDLLDPTFEGETYEDTVNYFKEITAGKPVAILVNPYASQRDIIDSVKKLYQTSILPILDLHKRSNVRIGKVRKNNSRVEERNAFIYENRNLSKKDLITLVHKKCGDTLDQSYLNKIIREERAKRK